MTWSFNPRTMFALLWLLAGSTALCACAGVSTADLPRDARAAGGTPTYRPVPLRELAFGRPQPGTNASASALRSPLAADLLPTASDEPSSLPAPQERAHAAAPVAAKAAPPVANRAAETPTAQPASTVAALQLASAEMPRTQRYAEREARSQSQQQYRGGDVLVITASTLVIVLLVVLIIVLLLK